MRDSGIAVWERLAAAHVLLHPQSPHVQEALRFVIKTTRQVPEKRSLTIPLLEKHAGKSDGSLAILRRVAASGEAPMRRRARIAIRRIQSRIKGGK